MAFLFDETDVAENSPCGNYVRYNKILGRGAFKDVYVASNRSQNVAVAWNQICFDEEEANLNESLYSESVLLKALDHTNIMKCYTFWLDRENKSMNMITELFVCGSLRQYAKKKPVDLETLKNWGRQILQGLHYLHTRVPCIVHRDLKCDNIFVNVINGGEIEIKIGDFGLATGMEGGPLRALVGTPEFMAPEYYDEEYNELVDVYAFGMCLLQLVTLECPYSECTNPAQIFKKVSTGVKPRALERVENREVKDLIDKCLLPASSRPSAGELLKDPFFSSSSQLISMGNERSSGEEEMDDESILSGISALYDSMTLSDASHCMTSSSGDASMNSRITVASSAGLCVSEPSSK